MKKSLTILLCFLWGFTTAQNIPIGTWRTHASYSDIVFLADAGDGLFAASSSGLFFFNNRDRSINRLSKTDGLSGGEYTALAFDQRRNTLVIGYKNGSVDLLTSDGEVTTLTDLRDASITGSKAINHIEIARDTYYLSLSLGVLAVNADEGILSATYRNLGAGGTEMPIYATVISDDSLFVLGDQEVLAAAINESVNLQDFNNYTRHPWPFQGTMQHIEAAPGGLLIGSDSLLATYSDGQFTEVTSAEGPVNRLAAYGDGVLVATENGVFTYEQSLAPLAVPLADMPLSIAGSPSGPLYVGDKRAGLIVSEQGNTEAFRPDGILHPVPSKLYSRGSIVYAMYADPFTPGEGLNGFSVFTNGNWTNYSADHAAAESTPLGGVVSGVTYRPASSTYYLSVSGQGLLLFDGSDSFEVIDNSTPGGPFFSQVPILSDIHTTALGEVLLSAYGENQPLYKLDQEGNWAQVFLSGSLRTAITTITSVFTGEYFLIARPQSGSGALYSLRTEPESGQQLLTESANDLPGRVLFDLAEDLDGRLWIGGLAGVAFLPFPSSVIEEPTDAQRPVFEQRFLLENETITSVTIDGGDRKWLGTYNGAWLFDDSGEDIQQIYHFTSENSPLPTDTIYDITINSLTGEVFFATSGGMVSYREGATTAGALFSTVMVFPNPVPSDFGGQVGISGLARDVSLKITNVRGKLIREVEAEGGTATWDLRDEKGTRAKPGVYVLFSADRNGVESYAGKLAILP